MKQMQWTTFEGRQYSKTKSREARVTLGHKSTFYLNGVAYEAMGRPSAVEMLFEGNERVIGLRRTDPSKKNAFKLRLHGKGNYWRLAASAFCKHFRIKAAETVMFEDVDLDDHGVLMLDLNKTIRVGRGSR
jgi:hypothetical protein